MVYYNTHDVKIPDFPKRKISLWIKKIAEVNKKRVGDISYIFCSEKKILEINNKYLKHDYFTDIITFDYTVNDLISGDIFISIDTVRSNSEIFKEPYDRELCRVIIHGILHLCGIEDKTPNDRNIMEKNENDALALLENSYLCIRK